MQNPLITIIGPTATGKSDLAVEVALYIEKKYNKKVEIISADSRQIYKYLDIGTGKITQSEMQGVPHHMLDLIGPQENFSVFVYGKMVTDILTEMYARGAVPILCGGTGFYIDAVIYGNVGAVTPPNIERQKELEVFTVEELVEKLQTLSKEKSISITHVDIKNKRRVMRAIDVLEHGDSFAEKNTIPLYNLLQIGLDTDTEKLRARIQRRLDVRIDAGMIEESEKLLESSLLTHEHMEKLGLEYRYVSKLIQKEITLSELMNGCFSTTWQYAKRQRIWFKRYTDVRWFDSDEVKENMSEVMKVVDEFLNI